MACECGCGRETWIANATVAKHGWVKGQPVRWVRGHATRRKRWREGYKWCSGCQDQVPHAEFRKDASRADGLANYCRSCADKVVETWRAKNRERAKANAVRRTAAHRERDPDKAREQWRSDASRRRSRKEGGERIDSLVVLELDDGVCGICGDDVDTFDYHVDHIVPLSRGGAHAYANVQVAHPLCNRTKSAKLEVV